MRDSRVEGLVATGFALHGQAERAADSSGLVAQTRKHCARAHLDQQVAFSGGQARDGAEVHWPNDLLAKVISEVDVSFENSASHGAVKPCVRRCGGTPEQGGVAERRHGVTEVSGVERRRDWERARPNPALGCGFDCLGDRLAVSGHDRLGRTVDVGDDHVTVDPVEELSRLVRRADQAGHRAFDGHFAHELAA